jgi:drug/metabolite transporter (DMT)-like permease
MNHVGEFAALFAAFVWTSTAMMFETTSRKVGSIPVNLIKLVIAFLLIGCYTSFSRGYFLPVDATPHAWLWLIISGLLGFVFGDLFLFKSFTIVGARISMLVMTLVPPLTAFIGWIFLREKLTLMNFAGMLLVLGGILIVVLSRNEKNNKIGLNHSLKGILFAFGGAVGQATGLVSSKYGMGTYNAIASTQIRIMAGIFGFAIMVTFLRRWLSIKKAVMDKKAMKMLVIASILGPFIGVSLSLYAVQHTSTGIASTLMATVPVLIIAPSVIIYKQKLKLKEIIGAVISVMGIVLFFL